MRQILFRQAGACLNADKHSSASSARSTKRWMGCLCQWELKAATDRSRSGLRMSALHTHLVQTRFEKTENKSAGIQTEEYRKEQI